MGMVETQARLALFYAAFLGALSVAMICCLLTVQMLLPGPPDRLAGLLMALPWALTCGVAATKRHLLAWSALCIVPLAAVSFAWLDSVGHEDPFGMRLFTLLAFVTAALVTAATGILALIPTPISLSFHRKANE